MQQTPNPSADAAIDAAMSFDAAQIRAQDRSATLQAADHMHRGAEHSAAAVANMNRPIVSVSANYLAYQKTLTLDLSDQRQAALDNTQDFLAGIPATEKGSLNTDTAVPSTSDAQLASGNTVQTAKAMPNRARRLMSPPSGALWRP